MPNIVIKEYDKTSAGIGLYANFAVVVPGFVKERGHKAGDTTTFYWGGYRPSKDVTPADKDYVFDENGVCEFTKQKDFEEQIGKVSVATCNHYGNQIAYELLGLGYTVLYKKLEDTADLADDDYWECLKDKSIYDFRYVVNGLLDANKAANETIIKLADFKNTAPKDSGRGDCIALVDVAKEIYAGKTQTEAITEIISEVNSYAIASKYAAIFAPFVSYSLKDDEEYGKNTIFPGYFHYLACAAKAAEYYNEWYAVAGYTRGISDYTINGTGCKFGEAAIEALEPRNLGDTDSATCAVNLVVKIKNNYYLWGNRTAAKLYDEKDSDLKASHFLNIRQLCTTIKKQIYIICRRYTFDPNSDVLWINFCNGIRPLLEKMKADQGITDYKFIKVKADKKALLKAKIRIVPIEAVEDFDISLYLEDSISGTAIGIDEPDADNE